MSVKDYQSRQLNIGKVSALVVSVLLIIYVFVTFLGFLSLKAPSDAIGDPFFSIMEILIIIISSLMLIVMVALDDYADFEVKLFSRLALIFMIIMTAITSSVHFVILTFSLQNEMAEMTWMPVFLSFKWPSIVYALDILAWDWFFALSFLFASQVFRTGRLENIVRVLMIVSGVLSLVGLLGVPLANMQIRNIGIIGYALVSPAVFFLLSRIFKLTKY